MRNHTQGLTILEVAVSLALLAIISSVMIGGYLGSYKGNFTAQQTTYASQLLNSLTSRVSQHVITLASGASQIMVFNSSSTSVPTSDTPTNCTTYLLSAKNNFCVTISNSSSFNPTSSNGTALLSSPADLYTIQACWYEREVKCAQASTIY